MKTTPSWFDQALNDGEREIEYGLATHRSRRGAAPSSAGRCVSRAVARRTVRLDAAVSLPENRPRLPWSLPTRR